MSEERGQLGFGIHRALSLMSVLCVFFSLSLRANAEIIHFYTTEEPPYNYTDEGVATGISVDVLRHVLSASDVAHKIEFLPWSRSLLFARTNKNSGLFSAARTPDRETNFVWLFPLVQGKKRILVRLSGDGKSQFSSLAEIIQTGQSIGVLRGDSREEFLASHGVTKLEPVSSHASNLKKLLLKRVDMIASSNDELILLAREMDYPASSFETAYVLFEGGVYLAMNKDSDPALLDRLRQGLRDVMASGSLKAVAEYWRNKTGVPYYFDPGHGIKIGEL